MISKENALKYNIKKNVAGGSITEKKISQLYSIKYTT